MKDTTFMGLVVGLFTALALAALVIENSVELARNFLFIPVLLLAPLGLLKLDSWYNRYCSRP